MDPGPVLIDCGRDINRVAQVPQLMQVHHLRDQCASDDTNAQSRLSQAARDYTPTTDDRSIHRVPTDLSKSIAVASAPVSFGAFEVTVGVDTNVPDAVSVFDAVQRDVYYCIDPGSLGYLWTSDQ